jgi:hypothetical protein
MKHSINLMLLCGVPFGMAGPGALRELKMPKFCDNMTAYHD